MKTINQLFILVFTLKLLGSSNIIGMERKKYDLKIDIYKDSLTALYDSSNGYCRLYIPEKELPSPNELKQIFANNNICTVSVWSNKPWSEENWNSAYKKFKEAPYDIFNTDKTFYTLNEVSKLLIKAKEITKSFLPAEKDVSFIIKQEPNEYIKKHSIRRLFTYAKLQQVIVEKDLTHIRLPIKFLFIKDTQANQYVSTKKALSLIDDILKICVISDTQFTIEPMSDRYTVDIFAKRETKKGKGFSKATMDELLILCQEAPFDIEFDSIFWDIKGDAVIIDTEHKQESARDCVGLKRYPVDESL
jgi:hypothetical protein